MNREIKFRGKDRENWHYGDLVQEIRHNDNKLFDGTMTHIRNFEYKNGDYIGDSFPVNSETIGQYTGLHDKNGKEIYEGDIVEITRPCILERGEVKFINGCFAIKSKDTLLMLYQCEINNFKLKVIGNIYDNPELLGGE